MFIKGLNLYLKKNFILKNKKYIRKLKTSINLIKNYYNYKYLNSCFCYLK